MSLFKKDKMREQFDAPSFSLKTGELFLPENEKELKEKLASGSYIVLFYPNVEGDSVNSWARSLSKAKYVIIPDSNKYAKMLYNAIERVVFSPVLKNISGVYLAKSEESAKSVLSSFSESAITVIPR